ADPGRQPAPQRLDRPPSAVAAERFAGPAGLPRTAASPAPASSHRGKRPGGAAAAGAALCRGPETRRLPVDPYGGRQPQRRLGGCLGDLAAAAAELRAGSEAVGQRHRAELVMALLAFELVGAPD